MQRIWTTIVILANCTPLAFGPPFVRAHMYRWLTRDSLLNVDSVVDPSKRPLGLRRWDDWQVRTVILATAFLPVALPLLLWIFIGLHSEWSRDITGKVAVSQLLASAAIGGVAIDVFLFAQLQRVMRARVDITWLAPDRTKPPFPDFTGRRIKREDFSSGERRFAHIRVTNVGTIHYPGLTVSLNLPIGWGGSSGFGPPDGGVGIIDAHSTETKEASRYLDQPPYPRRYRTAAKERKLRFERNLDASETSPGAGGVYSAVLTAPFVEHSTEYEISIIVSTDTSPSAGSVLKVRVSPE